ncbi:hypothetical protein MT355_15825 [Rathayibacter sp. VKM Ac-2929]|uniref:hypothetical protein n=2 Tax=unclassified Rathayibacter TaxID=2609250 RepID=UPI001FB495AD|nr:hypothetical protein [Rathayibacter sp. VKM Ac-2929]MCJ1674728.1 hypothetical protein [Rathayibacter sp. VKM Ac-2929]
MAGTKVGVCAYPWCSFGGDIPCPWLAECTHRDVLDVVRLGDDLQACHAVLAGLAEKREDPDRDVAVGSGAGDNSFSDNIARAARSVWIVRLPDAAVFRFIGELKLLSVGLRVSARGMVMDEDVLSSGEAFRMSSSSVGTGSRLGAADVVFGMPIMALDNATIAAIFLAL